MPKSSYKIDDRGRILITSSQIAREIGVTSPTINRRLKAAGIHPDADGYYTILKVIPFFSESGIDEVYSSNQDRLAAVRADREKLKLEQERAELVHVDDMRRTIYLIMKPVANLMDMIPQILERDCKISGAASEKAQRLIGRAREKFIEDMKELAEGEIEARDAEHDQTA